MAILLFTILTLIPDAETNAQVPGVQPQTIKQVPGPLPKLALLGAVAEGAGGVQYHKIILTITNWGKYNPAMFVLPMVPMGRKLPPNPCGDIKSRVAAIVYSERGAPLSPCIAMPQPVNLGTFHFLTRKGTSVPQFIYAVIHDQYTGGVYRSNLVSPWTGATK